jgi:DNA-binding phage protein
LEDGDPALFIAAIGDIARAKSFMHLVWSSACMLN